MGQPRDHNNRDDIEYASRLMHVCAGSKIPCGIKHVMGALCDSKAGFKGAYIYPHHDCCLSLGYALGSGVASCHSFLSEQDMTRMQWGLVAGQQGAGFLVLCWVAECTAKVHAFVLLA